MSAQWQVLDAEKVKLLCILRLLRLNINTVLLLALVTHIALAAYSYRSSSVVIVSNGNELALWKKWLIRLRCRLGWWVQRTMC